MTIVLSIATFALPRFPAAGESRPWWFMAYVFLFLVHWSLLSVVVTIRLWRAGRGQPGVASGRMRLLAFAAASLTLAIIGTAFQSGNDSVLEAPDGGARLPRRDLLPVRHRPACRHPRPLALARAAAPAGGDPRPDDARDDAERGRRPRARAGGGARRRRSVGRPRRGRRAARLARARRRDAQLGRGRWTPGTAGQPRGADESKLPVRPSSSGRPATPPSSATASCARCRPSPR